MSERVRVTNAISRIRRMVIKNPNVAAKKVIDTLGDDRPTDLVVESVMEHTREVLRECARLGKLKA
jgi:hypothetical protein